MDIQTTVERQREYFQSGATRSYAFRRDALQRLQQALHNYEGRIFDALLEDLGKPPMEAYMTEIGSVFEELRFNLRHLRGWMRNKRVPLHLLSFIRSVLSPPSLTA